MIIDSHCHLDFPIIYDDLDNVINRALVNNVKYMLTICTTPESFKKIGLIIKKYPNIFGTYGIHPHETSKNLKVNSKIIYEEVKKNNKVIGIGETGLDFFYENSEKKIQKKSFTEHIEAALNLKIPLIVHTRDAETETYEMLKDASLNTDLKVLIHCFTGSKDFAKKLVDLNCYISISGIVTFKNSVSLVDTVSTIPVDNLLVETDSPYLAPAPFRGKSNEPSYITSTIDKLSSIKNLSKNTIIEKTTNNFIDLFKLNLKKLSF